MHGEIVYQSCHCREKLWHTFIFRHIDWDRFLHYEIMQKRKGGIFKGFEVLQRDMRFDESNCCCRCDH